MSVTVGEEPTTAVFGVMLVIVGTGLAGAVKFEIEISSMLMRAVVASVLVTRKRTLPAWFTVKV